ncbi:MAG: HAD family phosphatase [Lachnospiraceae bacterium]|jgi:HAD superfamily hydrolase (TIGR01509 family)|nr:HAD family phosphatase [Lachnospiraceae bacterium]
MEKKLHLPKAVIFDMDGVLIDTEKYLVRYWCQAAREAGFPFEWEHGLMLRSLSMKFAEPKLKEIFGKTFDYKAIRERRKELMEEQLARTGIEKKPGVDNVLSWLYEHGIKRAVATATDEERANRYLKEIGIANAFEHIVCAPMVKQGKPCPDVYLYACQQIGERPEDCLALEDSPNGVLSAWRAGCQVVMVPDLTEPETELLPLLSGVAHGLEEVISAFSPSKSK